MDAGYLETAHPDKQGNIPAPGQLCSTVQICLYFYLELDMAE